MCESIGHRRKSAFSQCPKLRTDKAVRLDFHVKSRRVESTLSSHSPAVNQEATSAAFKIIIIVLKKHILCISMNLDHILYG